MIVLFLTLWGILSASAQDMIGLTGDSPFSTTFDGETITAGTVESRSIGASHLFERKGDHRFGVSGRYLRNQNSGTPVPDFKGITGGVTYQRFLQNDQSLSIISSYGSASDRPFRDGRDSTLMVNALFRSSPRWIWLGNYSNNRPFLNNVPLPGFLYIGEQSRERSVMLGFPFINYLAPIAGGPVSIRYLAVLPFNHRVKLSYTGWTLFRPFLSLEQLTQIFFDSDRGSDGLRTFWFERRGAFGVEKSFGPVFRIEVQAGAAFDREYFVARSFRGSARDRWKIPDAGFGGVTLRTLF